MVLGPALGCVIFVGFLCLKHKDDFQPPTNTGGAMAPDPPTVELRLPSRWGGWDTSTRVLHLLPCPSTIMRNVPRSLNWTGGMSERSSALILSVTPSSSIRTLLVAERQKPGEDQS